MYSDQLEFVTICCYVYVIPFSSCTDFGLLAIVSK
jgi:hypothetical protein